MTSMRREYGNEVFGQGTEAAQRPALQAAHARRHRMHPVTWVVRAIVVAVLSWDSWQTVQDVRQSRALHHPYAARMAASAGVCRHCEQDLHCEISTDSRRPSRCLAQ